ncbi:MAG TPA: hypothetical protein VEQ85_12705, partial [Lacipirellulaceae bacterium]|nr:hypothetical protein [Lacipirellulaceae bacterium]
MWQGVYGHDAVVERFRRSLAANRLASTYLFVGPQGVGKRRFAEALAKSLLCQANDPARLDPCGRCHSCVMCAAGTHPDVHVVQRRPDDKVLKLEYFIGPREHRNTEGFCHDVSLRPKVGRRSIGIIDDADWFNEPSANCLLKLLEEPPHGAVLMLLATTRSRQLPTILSRAQVVPFAPLPVDELAELLLAQQVAPDRTAAQELAKACRGSLARAREAANPQLALLRDNFAAAWRSGDFDPTSLHKGFDDFIADGGKVADARRQRFRQLLVAAGDFLRASLHAACDADEDPEPTIAALDRCLEAEEQLDRNANLATLL